MPSQTPTDGDVDDDRETSLLLLQLSSSQGEKGVGGWVRRRGGGGGASDAGGFWFRAVTSGDDAQSRSALSVFRTMRGARADIELYALLRIERPPWPAGISR